MSRDIMLRETIQAQRAEFAVARTPLLRDATMFVRTAMRYAADITVEQRRGSHADGKNCADLLALHVRLGDTLRITAIGDDAGEAIAALWTDQVAARDGWLEAAREA